MALGGGTFIAQNKVLPGSYINVISQAKASAELSDRGVCAIPTVLGLWEAGKVKTITNAEFQKDSMALFGYAYTADELKPLRDLFLNVTKAHLYKLPTEGETKASCNIGTAKLNGVEGNKLKLNVAETQITEGVSGYQIETYLGNTLVHTGVLNLTDVSSWENNEYWTIAESVQDVPTGWVNFIGGTNGSVQDSAYQLFLDEIESYTFNTIGYVGTNDTLKQLFATWTKRMRDEVGSKFQCVLHKYHEADYEGVISVENDVLNDTENDKPNMVYWVTGAEAGCKLNKTLTNSKYTGEYASVIDTKFTQSELEEGLKAGKFIFHKVNDDVRVLEDINTFVSITDEKSIDFASNQTIRVIDQSANDVANLFATKYLGNIPNDDSGRISLWNDILKLNQSMQDLRAITDFNPDSLKVEKGETKKSVVVINPIEPVNAMAQLYMTIIVL